METELLTMLNVAVYGSLLVGVVVLRRTSRVAEDGSFIGLAEVLKTRFPDLPPGFTLREGLTKARVAEPGLDWSGIDQALEAYEGYRYGGLPDSGPSPPVLSSLIAALRRTKR